MSAPNKIVFSAAVYKVQTMTDKGVRLTLELPETAIPQMAMLAECQRQGIPLKFEAIFDEQNAIKAVSRTTAKRRNQ